ncbi:MAG: MBOAT family protein, partial [Acutalibacter sp.]|nr:MBOAT family protein [Acutalibacter sp.]
FRSVKFGAQLAAWGVFKKLVIADRAAILVNTVFGGYPDFTGRSLWIAVLFYTVQIYADFSGGIDIARGVGQMFGVVMAENFERPYFAQSIAEFWRRWHMTLGGWCRDYIFYPLSLSKAFNQLSKKTRNWLGPRVGKLVPVILSQLIVFLIIGMWHGSQFKYIAFGLYHGAFIIGGILLEEPCSKWLAKLHIDPDSWWYKGFRILRTFLIVALGRFFSRAGSFTQAISMLKECFFPSGAPQPGLFALGMGKRELLILALAVLVLFLADLLNERSVALREWVAARPMPLRWALYLCGVLSIILFGVYGTKYDAAAFIYMRF